MFGFKGQSEVKENKRYIRMPPFPPHVIPANKATNVRTEMRQMLLACLTGGMTYKDAKDAVELELGDILRKAEIYDKDIEKLNSEMYEEYKKHVKEWQDSIKDS